MAIRLPLDQGPVMDIMDHFISEILSLERPVPYSKMSFKQPTTSLSAF